jgi:hypothetical protein
MGKGLSLFQKDILAVLAEIPALEELPEGDLRAWAKPRHILAALPRQPTESNRAALSKALARLYERGLVARASGEAASAGKSFRYVRINDVKNAFTGNNGPSWISGRAPKMRIVSTNRKETTDRQQAA